MLRLRHYELLSVQNRRFHSNGGRLTHNFRWNGSPPSTILLVKKTRLNDHSCGIRIWTHFSFVLSQFMRLTDGQTDVTTPHSRVVMRKKALMLSGVTRMGHTRGGNWDRHPSIFSCKPGDFLVASSAVSLFIDFTRVSPSYLEGVTPHFFTCPTSFLYCSL